VTGSPVTTSGTLAFSLVTACAQCVLANATGSTAAPTYHLITAAMLPSLTSAQLATILSDETGSGVAVFGTAPTISAPNVTGHPVIEGVTSTGATGTGKFVFDTSPTFTTSTILAGANGQTATQGVNRESLTLATGATTTATSGNLAPANSRIKAITYRVTTTITTAVSFTVKVTGGNAFASIGTATTSQTGMTATTTGVLVPAAYPDQYNTSATTLTVTTNANPGAGVIELSVFYESFVAPTS
jgi:hypothetical protein